MHSSIASACVNLSPNPIFDYLFESSRWDDSDKCSNVGFGQQVRVRNKNTLLVLGPDNSFFIEPSSRFPYKVYILWHLRPCPLLTQDQSFKQLLKFYCSTQTIFGSDGWIKVNVKGGFSRIIKETNEFKCSNEATYYDTTE